MEQLCIIFQKQEAQRVTCNPWSGSVEEVENVNSLTDDRRRTEDGRRTTRVHNRSLGLRLLPPPPSNKKKLTTCFTFCHVEMKDTCRYLLVPIHRLSPVTRGVWRFYCSSSHNSRVEWKGRGRGKGWERFSQATFENLFCCDNARVRIWKQWTWWIWGRWGGVGVLHQKSFGIIYAELCSIICT